MIQIYSFEMSLREISVLLTPSYDSQSSRHTTWISRSVTLNFENLYHFFRLLSIV